MIDIKRKKQVFHNEIRATQRQELKARTRKSVFITNQRKEIEAKINNVFSFSEYWSESKQSFWTDQFSSQENQQQSVFCLIDKTCQQLKSLIDQYQKDQFQKIEINYGLIQNLVFIIPPPQIHLRQLPKSFIELCLYLLRDKVLSRQEKEYFVETLPHSTINRCLLNQLRQNWDEISRNKSNDLTMVFFAEITKFKNIFKKYQYNDPNFEYLINRLIYEILQITQQQRLVYQQLERGSDYFRFPQTGMYQSCSIFKGHLQFQNKISQKKISYEQADEEQKLFYVIRNSIFLSQLLLMSPLQNYSIKEKKTKLKTIGQYLYRKIILKKERSCYKLSAQYCILILLKYSVDQSDDNHIKIIRIIINSKLQQLDKKQSGQISSLHNSGLSINFINQEQIGNNLMDSQNQSLYCQYHLLLKDDSNFQVNQHLFAHLCLLAANNYHFKFSYIATWLHHQFKTSEESKIFNLQNQNIISNLFSLLTRLINNENQAYSTFLSYSSNKKYQSKKHEDIFAMKMNICNMITIKGFNQIFNHDNIKYYFKEVHRFLVTLTKGLDQVGEISAFISSLIQMRDSNQFNQFSRGLNCFQKADEFQDKDTEIDCTNQIYQIVSAFKAFVCSIDMKFTQRCYKYLDFRAKQQMLLCLIYLDYLGEQDCRKYFTIEQRYKFAKNFRHDLDDEFDESDSSSGDFDCKSNNYQISYYQISSDFNHTNQKEHPENQTGYQKFYHQQLYRQYNPFQKQIEYFHQFLVPDAQYSAQPLHSVCQEPEDRNLKIEKSIVSPANLQNQQYLLTCQDIQI